jgi:hypothetical protein
MVYEKLLELKEFSDLTIIEKSLGESKEHRVHKLVVCSVSPYFTPLEI